MERVLCGDPTEILEQEIIKEYDLPKEFNGLTMHLELINITDDSNHNLYNLEIIYIQKVINYYKILSKNKIKYTTYIDKSIKKYNYLIADYLTANNTNIILFCIYEDDNFKIYYRNINLYHSQYNANIRSRMDEEYGKDWIYYDENRNKIIYYDESELRKLLTIKVDNGVGLYYYHTINTLPLDKKTPVKYIPEFCNIIIFYTALGLQLDKHYLMDEYINIINKYLTTNILDKPFCKIYKSYDSGFKQLCYNNIVNYMDNYRKKLYNITFIGFRYESNNYIYILYICAQKCNFMTSTKDRWIKLINGNYYHEIINNEELYEFIYTNAMNGKITNLITI